MINRDMTGPTERNVIYDLLTCLACSNETTVVAMAAMEEGMEYR